MSLYIDVSWREQYVSHALNRKFAGIMPVGVYHGFDCSVDAAGTVTVGEPDASNVAIAEVGGHSVTVRMTEPVTVSTTPEKPIVVVAPYYAIGAPSRVEIKAVAEPESHHLTLCTVTPGAETDSGNPEIPKESQPDAPAWTHGGSIDEGTLAQMAASQVKTMEQQVSQHQRLYDLEQAHSEAPQ